MYSDCEIVTLYKKDLEIQDSLKEREWIISIDVVRLHGSTVEEKVQSLTLWGVSERILRFLFWGNGVRKKKGVQKKAYEGVSAFIWVIRVGDLVTVYIFFYYHVRKRGIHIQIIMDD